MERRGRVPRRGHACTTKHGAISFDSHQRRRAVYQLSRPPLWPMDVVVFTLQEVEHFKDIVGTLVYTVVREGRTLYDAA